MAEEMIIKMIEEKGSELSNEEIEEIKNYLKTKDEFGLYDFFLKMFNKKDFHEKIGMEVILKLFSDDKEFTKYFIDYISYTNKNRNRG